MQIINIPIEPLEERYSAQWAKWWPREFEKLNVPYVDVKGIPLTATIEQGAFLDVIGTNYYKASQLQQIMEMIYKGIVESNAVFLFHDLWMPGLEMLAYVRDAMQLDFKIVGILHAGTYDPYDFLSKSGMGLWGKKLENSWFSFVDEIYVATEFHKQLIRADRTISSNKIKVTGLPIFPEVDSEYAVMERGNNVCFPHRLDSEKQPDEFDWLAEEVYRRCGHFDEWNFFKTKDCWTDKPHYYYQMKNSKVAVSHALQETWGIAMFESVFCGCVPLVPDRLSYKELYYPEFRYQNKHELAGKVIYYLENYKTEKVQKLLLKQKESFCNFGEKAIPNIIENIRKLK